MCTTLLVAVSDRTSPPDDQLGEQACGEHAHGRRRAVTQTASRSASIRSASSHTATASRAAARSRSASVHAHYYENIDLSWLGNRCCPSFPTGNASPGQKGVPFCPGSGNRDRRGPFVPVGNTNRDKRCSQRPRGWRTLLSRLVLPTGTKGLFFSSCFSFLNSFSISIILLHFN